MEGDIATVIDVSASQWRGSGHRTEHFLGDRAGHRCHRRDEAFNAQGHDGVGHAPRYDAVGTCPLVGVARARSSGSSVA